MLYGVLTGGGAYKLGSVFKVDPAGNFTTLFSFGSASAPPDAVTGISPDASLVFGADGNLYGSTPQGGPGGGGTIFRITTAGDFKVMFALGGGTSPPNQPNQPSAPLYAASDGNLYGSTSGQIWNDQTLEVTGSGTLFQMTLAGDMTTLHTFAADGSEGEGVIGALITGSDGALYGTTSNAGFNSIEGSGTVFRIDTSNNFSTLHYFPNTASNVIPGLTAAADGSFYGVTQLGGTAGSGTAFRVATDGSLNLLHTFACSCGTPDGSQPVGPLLLASDGRFYGVTSYGGTSNSGTLFSMTTDGVVTPLHSFIGSEGGAPTGGLTQGADGRFYGMTSGLFSGAPTIYSFALLPAAPNSVSEVPADGAISLSWGAVQSANTYEIFEGTASHAESDKPVLVGLTSTSATISGLSNGTEYFFQVVAVNAAGSGPPSSEVPGTPAMSQSPGGGTTGGGGGGAIDGIALTCLAGLAMLCSLGRTGLPRFGTRKAT